MKMNMKTTKVMCNEGGKKKPRPDVQIKKDGETLEEVDEYHYLGSLLTPETK